MRFALFAAMTVSVLATLAAAPNCSRAQCGSYYGGRVYDDYPRAMATYAYPPTIYRQGEGHAIPTDRDSYSRQPYSQRSTAQSYSAARPTYPEQRPTTVVSVSAYDNRFEPRTINVQPGTTVRWVNYGSHAHTVTAHNRSWDSGDIAPGQSYSATFKRPGTYTYYCRHHDGMDGRIVVGSEQAKTARTEGAAPAGKHHQSPPPPAAGGTPRSNTVRSPGY